LLNKKETMTLSLSKRDIGEALHPSPDQVEGRLKLRMTPAFAGAGSAQDDGVWVEDDDTPFVTLSPSKRDIGEAFHPSTSSG